MNRPSVHTSPHKDGLMGNCERPRPGEKTTSLAWAGMGCACPCPLGRQDSVVFHSRQFPSADTLLLYLFEPSPALPRSRGRGSGFTSVCLVP